MQHYTDPNLVILDASMKKRPNGEAIAEPQQKIIGALAFNFDTEICDHSSALPHMLPTAEDFEQAVRALGINQDSKIVVYDAMGIFSAPRAWWMFKIMGIRQVYVLNGGLPAWLEAKYPTQISYSEATYQGDVKVNFNPSGVYSAQQVLATITSKNRQILDARSEARFYGKEPEPRKELKGGHIPTAQCLAFDKLLHQGAYRTTEQLKQAFAEVLISPQKPLLFSCGSGVTACVLALAADEIGLQDYAVYDGSWSEWGGNDTLPIAT
ncbi:MAG: rhodanese-like domain-containing protein [Enterobacterales bacterium]|nr:rhodanese-like domain-containing protein [Enterobacterales bacterium]